MSLGILLFSHSHCLPQKASLPNLFSFPLFHVVALIFRLALFCNAGVSGPFIVHMSIVVKHVENKYVGEPVLRGPSSKQERALCHCFRRKEKLL